MQYIRVISSLQFQVFQFDLVCKHLGLSKKGEIAKNGNSNNGERKRRLSPLDFRVILTCSDDHHLSHTWLFYGLITHEIHHCLDRKGDSSYPGRRGYFKWLMNFHELLHIHISRSYSNICIYILWGFLKNLKMRDSQNHGFNTKICSNLDDLGYPYLRTPPYM